MACSEREKEVFSIFFMEEVWIFSGTTHSNRHGYTILCGQCEGEARCKLDVILPIQ